MRISVEGKNISRRLFPAHKFRASGNVAQQVLYPRDTDTISADKPDGTAVCVYVWAEAGKFVVINRACANIEGERTTKYILFFSD